MSLNMLLLLRKDVTWSSVITLALLVAIVSSANSVVNFFTFQTEALGSLINPSGKLIILSNSSSVTESKLGSDMIEKISSLPHVREVVPQNLLWAEIASDSGEQVLIRGIGNVSAYLRSLGARINGTVARRPSEACAGVILNRSLGISVGEELILAYNKRQIKVKVTCVFQTHREPDSELLLLTEAFSGLAGEEEAISIIQITLKDGSDVRVALNDISKLLPENFEVMQAQQLGPFIQQTNLQTLEFLETWSSVIYILIAGASYFISTRLIEESRYELAVLRAMGMTDWKIFKLIVAYTSIVAIGGSIIGISMGLVGAQVTSSVLNWIGNVLRIAPELHPSQAIRIACYTLVSALLGCVSPAYIASKMKYEEKVL